MSDPDQKRGIYRKYKVERTDGSSKDGGKHENCRYFVLDVDCDPFAIPALAQYAKHCRHKYPQLADDIERIIDDRPPGDRMEEMLEDP